MKTGFFEESPNNKSITRLGFAVMTVYAMIMGAWVFAVTKDYAATIAIFSAIETLAMGGKLIQKTIENKPPEPAQ
jgi:hypothetical protein